MAKFGSVFVVGVCMLSMVFVMVLAKAEETNNRGEVDEEGARSTVEEVLMDAISILTVTSAAAPPTKTYWSNLRSMVDGLHAYFFPPKIDFGEGKEADGGEAVGEKVKEALSKSMEKSRETMEGSAKSAAKIATQALQNTNQQQEPEL